MRHLYPPPREPLHRLCYEVSPRYIERGDLVDRISDSFNRHPSRPVLLCGASGCGTTQVALRYAQKYEKDYRVLWLIDCADGITARRDLAELAKDLRLPFYNCLRARPDLGHGAAEALRWLDYNEDWLLIFDGAKDPEVILPLLPTECTGHVLITTSTPDWPFVISRRPSLTWVGDQPSLLPGAEVTRFTRDEEISCSVKLHALNDKEGSSASVRFLLALNSYPLALGIVGVMTRYHLVSQLWKRACAILGLPKVEDAVSIQSDEEALDLVLRLAVAEYESTEGAGELLRLCAVLGDGRIPDDLLVAIAPHLAEDQRPKARFHLEYNGLLIHSPWGGRRHRVLAERILASLRRAEHRELVGKVLTGTAQALHRLGYGITEPVPAAWISHVLVLARRADSLGLLPETVADLLGRSGRSLLLLGLPDLAIPVLEEELAKRLRRSLSAVHSDAAEGEVPAAARPVLEVLRDLGRAASASGQPERAIEYLRRALRLLESTENPLTRAQIEQQLGEAALDAHQFELAAESLLRALSLAQGAQGAEPAPSSDSLSLALCADEAARSLEFVPSRHQEVLPLREKARLLAAQESAAALGSSARMLRLGELQEEAGALERAIESFDLALKALPGPEHYKLKLRLNRRRAALLVRTGRLDEARSELIGALCDERVILGMPASLDTAELHHALAHVEEKLDDLEEAAAHYQRALELYRELDDPAQLIVGVLHMKLGRLGMRRGDREAALKHCGRGWPLIERAGDRLSQAERTEYAALREELLRVEGPPPAALPLRSPTNMVPQTREPI